MTDPPNDDVTVTVYAPAVRLERVVLVEALSLHDTVYDEVYLVTVRTIEPLFRADDSELTTPDTDMLPSLGPFRLMVVMIAVVSSKLYTLKSDTYPANVATAPVKLLPMYNGFVVAVVPKYAVVDVLLDVPLT